MYSETLTYRSADDVNTAMSRVYSNMGLAICTSMLISYFVGMSPTLLSFFFTGIMKWIVIFSPIVAIFGINSILANEGLPKYVYHLILHGFAALMGLSFATIFAVFNIGSVVSAFMGAAVLFGALTAYGYFTRRSLDSLGKWLFVGVVAIVISSLINLFLGNSVFQTIISAAAVLVFSVLTAYDTQRIRNELMASTSEVEEIRGALSLYLDFINIFISLLQLFGDKKE